MSGVARESAPGAVVEIKGTALKSTLLLVRERLGEMGLDRLQAELPPEIREAVTHGILVGTFYPVPWLVRIQDVAARLLGGDRRACLRDFGRFSADKSLEGPYRVYLRVGSPEYILGKAAQFFEKPIQGAGGEAIRVLTLERGAGRMQIDPFPGGHADLCDRLDGYFEEVLVLAGARNVRVTHVACAWRGEGPTCEWTGSWE